MTTTMTTTTTTTTTATTTMPAATLVTRTDEQLARQHALSQAMGALFLEARVQDLEQSVERVRRQQQQQQQQHQRRCHRPGPQGRNSPPTQSAAGSLRIKPHQQQRGGLLAVGTGGAPDSSRRTSPASSIASGASASLSAPASMSNSLASLGKGKARCAHTRSHAAGVRVVDVSVLVYSLRSVHTWLREGLLTLIVPYGALHTLDLLKSGRDTINHAARKALCFIEERLTDGSPFAADGEQGAASSSSSQRRYRPGLFIQGADHTWTDEQLLDLRTRREAEEELEALISDLGSGADDFRCSPQSKVAAAEGVQDDDDSEDEVILVSTHASADAAESRTDDKDGKDRSLSPSPSPVGWQLAKKGSTPRHVREVLTCAFWVRDEAARQQRLHKKMASENAGTGAGASISLEKQSKADKSKGDAAAADDDFTFALAVAYPPPSMRDPSGETAEASLVSSAEAGNRRSYSSIADETLLSPRSTGSGANEVAAAAAAVALFHSTPALQANGGARGKLGYAALADGLLTHRWTLSYGLGAEEKDGERAVGAVAASVEVVPTATSWLDIGKSAASGCAGGGVARPNAAA